MNAEGRPEGRPAAVRHDSDSVAEQGDAWPPPALVPTAPDLEQRKREALDRIERVQTAINYTRAGWPVFPVRWTDDAGQCSCYAAGCGSPGKHPMTPNGLHDASTDEARIWHWWSRWPDANVAIATGGPGPDVVDFDVKDGARGAESFDKLKAAGLLAGAFAMVSTWSGGWHLYYPGTEQGNGSIRGAGVDFRSLGGYVLAPPSTIRGAAYRTIDHRAPSWATVRPVSFDQIREHLVPRRTAPMPPRVLDLGGGKGHADLVRWVGEQGPGNRNHGLFWAACRAAETGAGPDVFMDLIVAAVGAGLSNQEASATVNSARRRVGGRR